MSRPTRRSTHYLNISFLTEQDAVLRTHRVALPWPTDLPKANVRDGQVTLTWHMTLDRAPINVTATVPIEGESVTYELALYEEPDTIEEQEVERDEHHRITTVRRKSYTVQPPSPTASARQAMAEQLAAAIEGAVAGAGRR